MKQIVDKLNNIAKAIDENVELPTTDLIVDSLDAITRAYGGTPLESNLIVDKLEDIAGVAHGGITPTGTINITDTALTDVAQYRYAQISSETLIAENIKKEVDILGVTGTYEGVVEKHYVIPEGTYTSTVQQGLSGIIIPNTYFFAPEIICNIDGIEYVLEAFQSYSALFGYIVNYKTETADKIQIVPSWNGIISGAVIPTTDTEPTNHTISAYYIGEKRYWQIIKVYQSDYPLTEQLTYWDNDSLRTYKTTINNDEQSKPILVYPYASNIYGFYNSGNASEIICGTAVSLAYNRYVKPSNENNLAFITWSNNAV